MKIRKILCPIDFSEASMKGLKEAIKYALHFDAELCLAHVVYNGIPAAADAVSYLALSPELFEIPRQNAERKLRELTDELQECGVRTTFALRAGEAGIEIVRMAEELSADVIVLATHGWTGWRRILFGSVAERVVRYARCSVLTVPVRRRSLKKIPAKPILVTPPLGKRKRLAAAA